MPANTRLRNKDAELKVYCSKKIPKQKYFPARRKTVCEGPRTRKDALKLRQMTFFPEKMQIHNTVRDSEEESNGGYSEWESSNSSRTYASTGTGKRQEAGATRRGKRKSDAMRDIPSEEDEGPVRPIPKRTRKSPAIKWEDSPPLDVQFNSSDNLTYSSSPPSESEPEEQTHDRIRRQSTMTQIVSGRKPRPDEKEPEYKPVKRGSRKSWDRGPGKKDKQQRTLTQMVPGLTPFRTVSDDDIYEEEEVPKNVQSENDHGCDNAIARHLSRRGVLQPQNRVVRKEVKATAKMLSMLEKVDSEDEDEYHPTQNVNIPPLRRKPALRRVSGKDIGEPVKASRTSKRIANIRFGLLSTPEKRKVREIPSSQSPVESLLSTQSSPEKTRRSPLNQRSANSIPDTPSKQKQVIFQAPPQSEDALRSKRTIRSIVQDSEEEEEDWSEENDLNSRPLINRSFRVTQAIDVGSDIHALIDQIDQVCAHASDDAAWAPQNPSEELGVPISYGGLHDVSQELKNPRNSGYSELTAAPLDRTGSTNSPMYIKAEPLDECGAPPSYQKHECVTCEELFFVSGSPVLDDDPQTRGSNLPTNHERLISTPHGREGTEDDEDPPSAPIVVKDEPSTEEAASPTLHPSDRSLHPTPHERSPPDRAATDLDGEPIEVPQSPEQAHSYTQGSQSSKAEQQLYSELSSYAQYRCALPSLSMHVAHDPFSYRATPFPAPAHRQQAPYHAPMGISQATTVDSTQLSPMKTPSKAASQLIVSANTTPQKVRDSHVFVSPLRPPSLVIPSSHPTPGRDGVGEWSSPVSGPSGNGIGESIEDFSIPPPPPNIDENDDDDDDDDDE
ncbi:hypothetical protein CC78DRAFT_570093 [Lojkania enalia]|uniref:Uncharacterized protein n=1 Tax=Lojkania enalia TaxID=147567 RepID=A0A9P4K4G4_9PLEO|nr:hypothetical protein CC78DRAFT_570093 [Didymosphaeria enalia]